MHDRRIRGTRANIDHIVIGPPGVWVIDAKRWVSVPRCGLKAASSGRVWSLCVSADGTAPSLSKVCSPRSNE
ncbi:nuclease-related domain-containing protein [Microbacterium ulmi]|uniref:nuclease-related domain-containing protein n=1 Tax=Microbacterium ulmi TaxID=179095 RepID=UPI00201E1E25|nr:nuclease-related domain-containing protein [Microbacterium ulmi]